MPLEARISALRPSTTPTTICGLTPRKTKRLSERMRCGVSAVQPSRCAAAPERSRVEHATAMRSPPVFFAAASASAPPILPAPMKPASYFAIKRPSLPDLSAAADDVFVSTQLVEAHGAAGVELLR